MKQTIYTFTRKFVQGTFHGRTQRESLRFVSDDAAERWAAGINENTGVDYVVLNMTNTATGRIIPA